MKRKSFLQGVGWLLLLNLLVKPVWIFLIDREVQNSIGEETYGEYFALFGLSYVLLFAADAGLTNMAVQQMASDHKASNLRRLLWLKAGLLLLYACICVAAGWLSGISAWPILLLLIAVQASGSLLLFLRGFLAANQHFKADAFFSIADKAGMILFCAPVLYGGIASITITLFLQLQLAATAISLLALAVVLYRKKLFATGPGPAGYRLVLQRMLPFTLVIFLMALHYRLDGFLLERLRTDGDYQAGIYAMSYRILDAANMVGYLTASFLVPFLARNKNDKALLSHTLFTTEVLLVAAGIVVSSVVALFAMPLQQVLYHSADGSASLVMQLCLGVLPAYYLIHVNGSVLTATGRLRLFSLILLISVLVNVAGNLLLIPAYGAAGCCYAALASQYGCAAACFFAARKTVGLSPAPQRLLYYALGFLATYGGLALLQSVFRSVWAILAAGCVVALLIMATQRKKLEFFIHSFTQL